MSIEKLVTAVQHLGIPTNDIEATIKFYESLGFQTVLRAVNGAANGKVAFLRLKNLTIETYQNDQATGKPGAIDHIALDVTDVQQVFDMLSAEKYHLLDKEVQFLPFWKKGVKFFTILGPNGEKIEFSQML